MTIHHPGEPKPHAAFLVEGINSPDCEKRIRRSLQDTTSVWNVKVSHATCCVEFNYDDASTNPSLLVELVQKTTEYKAKVIEPKTIRSLLLTVPSAHLDGFISMTRPQGVEVVLRSGKDTVLVVYDSRKIGARDVLQNYTNSNYASTLAPEPPDPTLIAGAKHIRSLTWRTVLSAALTIPVLIMTWAPLPPHRRAYAIANLVLATIIQTAIAGPFYVAAFKALIFERAVEEELLVVLSTSAAYGYSVVAFAFEMIHRPLSTPEFFETSTLLVTLIMVGELISSIARHRAIEAVSIRSLQASKATIIDHRSGTPREEEIDVRLLHYGDRFKVLPDSSIITDGVVIDGTSEVNESMMTGESLPVEKKAGDQVIAGTTNTNGVLTVQVTRLPGDNTITDIASMVDEALLTRAKVQEAVDWVSSWFVPVVLTLGLITFAIWMAVGAAVRHRSKGSAAVTALTYAITVLAIACPCAILVAVPMVILIAGGVGAGLGLVFKEATTIEQARNVTHAVFDKTGTLTQGRLSVKEHVVTSSQAGMNMSDVSAAVAQLVDKSRHPVSRAVQAHLGQASSVASIGDTALVLYNIKELPGQGVQGDLQGPRWTGYTLRGGSPKWLGVENHAEVKKLLSMGLTTFCLVLSPPAGVSELTVAYGLQDEIRPEASSVIQSLYARNIRVSILSGDNHGAVSATATQLGIDPAYVLAGCSPAQKQEYIKGLIETRKEIVLFCGDGTNDAAALATANIGVHLHSGEPGAGIAASSAAEVVLTNPSLTGILALIQLSDAVRRRIMLNFVWSFVYNVFAIGLAAGAFVKVRIPPAYAGLGEAVSVVPVILIALHLRWFKPSLP